MLENVFDLSTCESVELIPIGDVHIGNPLCAESEFAKVVEYIKQEPSDPKCARVCILNGDLTECITKGSLGDVFDGQVYSPQTQIALMTKYLLPLTETSKKYPHGKIVSFCFGNHDHQRQYKESGISVATSIACNLGLEDRSSADGCYSFLKVRSMYCSKRKDNVCYTIYNQHMSGGGSTIGAKANRVNKISNGIIADLIIGSHVHTPMTFKEDVIMPRTNRYMLVQQTITYVITNAFLYYGDYSQRAGMKPATISVPIIYLYQNREVREANHKRLKDTKQKMIEVKL